MCFKKNKKKKVEQVNEYGEIVLDYDEVLKKSEIFDKLKKCFPNIRKENGLIVGTYENINFSIMIKNLTYLGNPHPIYKKRIQINGLQRFYQNSIANNYLPLLMGIYSYKDVTLYCDFSINTYIYKKSHSSSAHVYTEDMQRVYDEEYGGIFEKEDNNKNTIIVYKPEFVSAFLEEKLSCCETESISLANKSEYVQSKVNEISNNQIMGDESNQNLLKLYNEFFEGTKKEWFGIECYKEMQESNYRNKYQAEWAGYYLEYIFEKYIEKNKLETTVKYVQDKKENGIDLDLHFQSLNAFGDLKMHSNNSKSIQGNDWGTIFNILNTDINNHIYYIVCEHSTEKDKDHDYITTKYWNKSQKKSSEMSYSKRMKYSVDLIKYYILDINNYNKQFLTKFRQGINSNGKLRKPKIMIDIANIDKFKIIETVFK